MIQWTTVLLLSTASTLKETQAHVYNIACHDTTRHIVHVIQAHVSSSAPCDVVIYHSLNVLISLHFSPGRVVSRHSFWVHIDDLSISFVLEQEAFLIFSNHLKLQYIVNTSFWLLVVVII